MTRDDAADSGSALPALPARDPMGHKGTFGTVCIVGGCALEAHRMFGAPALSARAALRSGCGLAKLLVPSPLLDAAVSLVPSATARGLPVSGDGGLEPHAAAEVFDEATRDASCIVVGPGLGPAGSGAAAITLRALGQDEVPVVVDADAINALSATPDFQRDFRASAVLTPHPGEFRRLAASLRIAGDPTDAADRPDLAQAMALRLGAVVVLKGMGTVVSDGLRTWVCERGHPCLATAGTGDVLAGLIGGLVAQFVSPARGLGVPRGVHSTGEDGIDLFDAARLGVQVHALAGERWAATNAEAGLLAAELADLLPVVIDGQRGGPSGGR